MKINIKEILESFLEDLLCIPRGGSYRDDKGNKFNITPYGDIGLDLKDERTQKNFHNTMVEHYEKHGDKMSKIIRRNRQMMEEERQAKLRKRCCCKCKE